MRSEGRQGPDHKQCSHGRPFGFYSESVGRQQKGAEQMSNMTGPPLMKLVLRATDGSVSLEGYLSLPNN